MDHEPSQQPKTQKLHLLSFLFPITIQKEVKYALCFLLFLLSSFVIFNLVTPIDSQFIFGTGFFSQILPNNQNTSLGGCDFSNGRWVWDESYSLQSYTENCQFLDPGFRCNRNGRKDGDYRKWRWQPKGCDLPRYGFKMEFHACMIGCTFFIIHLCNNSLMYSRVYIACKLYRL